MADGHLNKCKECNKTDVRANYTKRLDQYRAYDKLRQRRSKRRIFAHRYSQLKQRVEGRAVRPYPVEGREILSYGDYCVWVTNNMDVFDDLYATWEQSGFSRKLTPSIDRINNDKGYTMDNMQWITVSDNSKKGAKPF